MTELGSRGKFVHRIEIEENEKEDLCLANSLQWVIEDILKDPTVIAKINFEEIRNLRRNQLNSNSPLQQQLREAWALAQGGTATYLNFEAEEQVITSMVSEVNRATGIILTWSRAYYSPNDFEKLINDATIGNTECILLTPGHAQPLFPQRSPIELQSKLNSGSVFNGAPYNGNIILFRK